MTNANEKMKIPSKELSSLTISTYLNNNVTDKHIDKNTSDESPFQERKYMIKCQKCFGNRRCENCKYKSSRSFANENIPPFQFDDFSNEIDRLIASERLSSKWYKIEVVQTDGDKESKDNITHGNSPAKHFCFVDRPEGNTHTSFLLFKYYHK